MSDLTFYTNPMSRGQIARWMLEEAGVDYEQVVIEYGPEMKSDDYLAINPMGKVPSIKHNGQVVTEAAAICTYVADVFPDANLSPRASERADYYRWMFFTAGPVESAVINKSLGVEPSEDQQRMAGYGSFDLAIEVLDTLLGTRSYVCGDRFTAADVYVGSQVDWGLMFKSLPETDNFKAYAERLRSRPAYIKSKQIDMALMPDNT